MSMEINVFTKDQGRYLSAKLRAALVAKFGEDKIGQVKISQDGNQISIEANLTITQWNAIKARLDTKGYKPDEEFDFS